jgi:predicted enzyme related to lactoylglutathione lyase
VHFDDMGRDAAGVWSGPDGARVAWFHDPDGNLLSLTRPAGPAVIPSGDPRIG